MHNNKVKTLDVKVVKHHGTSMTNFKTHVAVCVNVGVLGHYHLS